LAATPGVKSKKSFGLPVKEAIQMTAYVFVFVVVMALFLWLTDKTLEWVFYDLILGWKR
jgi:preprotein translocase subunit SecE